MRIFSFKRPLEFSLARLYRLGNTFLPPNCKFADCDNVPVPMQLLCYAASSKVEDTAFKLSC